MRRKSSMVQPTPSGLPTRQTSPSFRSFVRRILPPTSACPPLRLARFHHACTRSFPRSSSAQLHVLSRCDTSDSTTPGPVPIHVNTHENPRAPPSHTPSNRKETNRTRTVLAKTSWSDGGSTKGRDKEVLLRAIPRGLWRRTCDEGGQCQGWGGADVNTGLTSEQYLATLHPC